MNITIFGTGYVGLVTGTCLADAGHHVMCVDVDKSKIDRLNEGIIPIFEPGLEQMVRQNVESARLSFTTQSEEAVRFGTLQFIAVGTPPGEDGSADLQYVLQVAETIGRHMDDYKVVINKSTVPVGTAEKVQVKIAKTLQERGIELDYDVCSNPEFLKEGAAIEDFTRGARIVVGTRSEKAIKLMRECYAPYNRNREKIMIMDVRSAELTKYAANAMLATKISFMNEMANLAERLGADIEQVRQGIGSDPRIGYHFIYPGCGYGGSCFPKDVQALSRTAQQVGYKAEMLEAVEAINERQKHTLFEKLSRAFNGELEGKKIGVWGLAFKPNTDDMREAPSRVLMESLWEAGAQVYAYDPEAMPETRHIYGDRDDLTLCERMEEAIEGVDALVICTEWKQFRAVNLHGVSKAMKTPVVIDGRNLFSPLAAKEAGITYVSVGR
ncbi:UDP-glucose dehydrogenase family protein [Vreelandella zhanjiangensis]|uniref:UDP-glucose dehydrogenase family protein n=1 Tax=Vreelandella zhanjiangensis TaxID=1121960 RepID=UPI00035EC2E5|nr:UDP-glucose/GDP-mannose dehydrogenase family protein [Halomonas zhanjiangensis]